MAISVALPTFAQQTNTPDPQLRDAFAEAEAFSIQFARILDEIAKEENLKVVVCTSFSWDDDEQPIEDSSEAQDGTDYGNPLSERSLFAPVESQ